MIHIENRPQGILALVFDRKDKPMNVIDEAFIESLEKNVTTALTTPGLKGIIFTSAQPTFIAGADLTLFERYKVYDDLRGFVSRLHKVFRQMEKAPVPVVAAINGTALGGGYELCLACHYRIAVNSPKIQIGLPEVTLGILPGAGGTQRLPRLIGYQKAIPLLIQGTRLKPEAAKEQGLVDLLVKDEAELMAAAESWILNSPKNIQPWDETKFKLPGGELHSPKGYQFFAATTALMLEKTQGNYPGPKAILSCVYEGLQVGLDAAIEIEMNYFADLAQSKEAQSMIRTLFFHIGACEKGAARPADIPKTEVQKLSILGAGMMGAGVAHVSAQSGMQVVLKDIKQEVAENGKKYSYNLLAKDLAKGKIMPHKQEETLARILPTTDPKAVSGSQLVIEAVIEDREIKAKVTAETEANTSADCIFASNTSTLPITGLAERSSRPENFIGIHFFSPVERMQLVEIIMGKKTGKKALAVALDYVRALKKTPIVVNDGRGFYTSRVFTKYIEEGVLCLCDGISPAVIENAGKAAGMPVGPLSVADEVSIDLVYHILQQTKKDLGAGAVNADLDKVAVRFVEILKRLGRKSGGGFYEYPKDGKKFLWPELTNEFRQTPERNNVEEVKTRLLYAQVLETLRCFEDGVLTTYRDADVGSVLGWGFPAYCGGTVSFIDFVGIQKFAETARRLEKTYGTRFRAPNFLVERAEKNQSFYG